MSDQIFLEEIRDHICDLGLYIFGADQMQAYVQAFIGIPTNEELLWSNFPYLYEPRDSTWSA